ncbi:hypothetical protein YC2023_002106 [Brassica napus]
MLGLFWVTQSMANMKLDRIVFKASFEKAREVMLNPSIETLFPELQIAGLNRTLLLKVHFGWQTYWTRKLEKEESRGCELLKCRQRMNLVEIDALPEMKLVDL